MRDYLIHYLWSICLILTCILLLNGGAMAEQFYSLQDVPGAVWNTLAEKKLYFGHQSVGFDILDGIEDLIAENSSIKLHIVKTTDPAAFESSIFGHSTVGRNTDPQSKIKAFANVLEKGVGEKADIAFLKFCFIDFDRKTENIEETFIQYKEMITRSQEKFPHVTFIHFTVPLTAKQSGPKAWLKKTLGKGANEDNVARKQFNDLIKAEYEGNAPLFDLAKIESTFPDGERSSFTKGGNVYYTLVPDYTDDGGHLNEFGRKVVAEKFLVFITNIL